MPVRACANPVYPTLTNLVSTASVVHISCVCNDRGTKTIVIALETTSPLHG